MQYREVEKSGVCECCNKEFLILAKFDEYSKADGWKPFMPVYEAEDAAAKFESRLQAWINDKRCLFCDPRYADLPRKEISKIITKEGICDRCGEEIMSAKGRTGVMRQCRVMRLRDQISNIWFYFINEKDSTWYLTPRCSDHMTSPRLRMRKNQTEAGARLVNEIRDQKRRNKIRLSNDPTLGGGGDE